MQMINALVMTQHRNNLFRKN